MRNLLKIDPEHLKSGVQDEPFQIEHDLSDHPLLQLERLVELARNLDGDRIEYNSGKLQPGQDPDATPSISLSPEETVRQIETCDAWMVLKNVETVDEYKVMLESCLYGMADQAGLPREHFSDIRGFIFVSSANSTTPFHVDPEDNFLVQIKGKKIVHIFDNQDYSLVPEKAFEQEPGKHRNLAYEESFEERAEVFELEPGDGLRISYFWPHWVRTADEYSISMAITWKTPEILDNNKTLLVNAMLRKMGWPQKTPGETPYFDKAKVLAFDTLKALIDPLRRSEGTRRYIRRIFFGKNANYYYKTKESS